MATQKKITPVYLDSLKPGRHNREVVIDAGHRGQGTLLLRVTDYAKPIYYRYFVGGKRRFELVGYFDPEGTDSWRDPSRDDAGTKGGN